MLTWGEFARERADLAAAGRELMCFFGLGLGFLGTVRKDGGPRLHPICPVITGEGLYAFIGRTPKLGDLLRDGRYALHSNPLPDNDDAFYVTGRAEHRTEAALRSAVSAVYFEGLKLDAPWPGFEDETFFELLIAGCLLTRTPGHGGPYNHTIWRAPA